MRHLTMPTEQRASQEELLRRIRSREHGDAVAHLRAVVALLDNKWCPVCGRVDIARPDDAPKLPARPVGSVRLLVETVTIATVVERLAASFRGDAFMVQGEALLGHGMNSTWGGGHQTDDWRDYGATWPVFSLAPATCVTSRVYLHEVIEAEGVAEAFDGLDECVRVVMGFRDSGGPGVDMRFARFQVIEWDYRGKFGAQVETGMLRIKVAPAGDANLKLSFVARDGTGRIRKTVTGPSEVEIPVTGELLRVNVTLRHADNIVCELMRDLLQEEATRRLSGHGEPSTSAQESVEPEPPSTVAELLLGFVTDTKLAAMVTRDLEELDVATKNGANKAAVLLIGSILEAVLLDVLGRNEQEARNRLGKKWPERASLKDLIDTAAGITVALPDGSTTPVLPPLTGKKGVVVTDHRDLIHPRAEVRGDAPIDESTATTMRGVLGEVLHDLRQAHERGVLDEYGHGHVV